VHGVHGALKKSQARTATCSKVGKREPASLNGEQATAPDAGGASQSRVSCRIAFALRESQCQADQDSDG